MEIVCFDMEGTLTPEIWEQIALNTGVEEFNKTTRDIPDYSDLMDFRLEVMKKHNLKLSDIQKASIHSNPSFSQNLLFSFFLISYSSLGWIFGL